MCVCLFISNFFFFFVLLFFFTFYSLSLIANLNIVQISFYSLIYEWLRKPCLYKCWLKKFSGNVLQTADPCWFAVDGGWLLGCLVAWCWGFIWLFSVFIFVFVFVLGEGGVNKFCNVLNHVLTRFKQIFCFFNAIHCFLHISCFFLSVVYVVVVVIVVMRQ